MKLEQKIEKKIERTLSKVKLFKKKTILVALSGGKDSATTAYMFRKLGYKIEGFHIDLGMGDYSKRCLSAVVKLCEILEIPLYIYDIKNEMGSSMCYLRTSIQKKHFEKQRGEIKNCAICGVIKKWILNKRARELGFEIIATGHNLDDEAQTFLMNVLKGAPELSANTGVVTKNILNKKFIPRVKPLFYIDEDEIRKFTLEKKLPVVYEGCPCLIDSYRKQVREWIYKNLTTRDKENLIKNFEKLQSRMKSIKSSELVYCEICGEPSRGGVCKKCKLFT